MPLILDSEGPMYPGGYNLPPDVGRFLRDTRREIPSDNRADSIRVDGKVGMLTAVVETHTQLGIRLHSFGCTPQEQQDVKL